LVAHAHYRVIPTEIEEIFDMRIAPMLAAAVLALSFAGPATPSIASPTVPHMSVADTGSGVDLVHYYGHCVRWRHICADRWGWGTWRFRRCLRIHGC
jgi:hypothetical protein